MLVGHEYVEKYNGIAPALLLYFENGLTMPIRQHRFEEYEVLINQFESGK